MWKKLKTAPVSLLLLVLWSLDSTAQAKSTKKDATNKGDPFVCDPDKLLVYRVTLSTHWSRTNFPKQYPEWRPPAQWSKMIGRSHDPEYRLFGIGHSSSQGFKEFAEKGRSDTLDAQSQGEGGIFDEFSGPPVPTGEGRTEAEFFVDSNHSMVSVASRIVPSPDWFVGLDSFNLCIGGEWVDSVAIKVGPIDAGTDNGFTFTAPNWPSTPLEKIFRITSQQPNHPANSFYYPELNDLPPIATFFFVKVKEYELAEIYDTVTLPMEATTESLDKNQQQGGPKSSNQLGEDALDDRESANKVIGEQNNETTLGKKTKRGGGGHHNKGKGHNKNNKKSALLKTLVPDSGYSRRERAKKNRRGRKSTHLS